MAIEPPVGSSIVLALTESSYIRSPHLRCWPSVWCSVQNAESRAKIMYEYCISLSRRLAGCGLTGLTRAPLRRHVVSSRDLVLAAGASSSRGDAASLDRSKQTDETNRARGRLATRAATGGGGTEI
jgi:hypothetical protein